MPAARFDHDALARLPGPRPDVAAGVRWLGVEDGEPVVHCTGRDALDRTEPRTLVLGTAHGPRLLELLGTVAGC